MNPHTSHTEADTLLHAAGTGDLAAFGRFYDCTAPWLWGLLFRVLGDGARAELVAQRVYLDLWRNAPSFDPADASALVRLLRAVRPHLTGDLHDVLLRSRRSDRTGRRPHDRT